MQTNARDRLDGNASDENEPVNDEMWGLVEQLEVGDDIDIRTRTYRVAEISHNPGRKIIKIDRHGSPLDRSYRLESDDPTDPDNDQLRIILGMIDGFDRSNNAPIDVEEVTIDGEPVVNVDESEDIETDGDDDDDEAAAPALIADGGVRVDQQTDLWNYGHEAAERAADTCPNGRSWCNGVDTEPHCCLDCFEVDDQ